MIVPHKLINQADELLGNFTLRLTSAGSAKVAQGDRCVFYALPQKGSKKRSGLPL